MVASPSLLSLLFWVIFFIAFIASIIFIYHWQKYGTDAPTVKKITTLYAVVTIALLVIAWLLLRSATI